MTPEQKEYYAQKLKEYRGRGRCSHDAYVIDCVFGMGSPNLGPVDPPVVGFSNDDDSFYVTYFQNWDEVNAFIAQVRETAEQAWGKEGEQK